MVIYGASPLLPMCWVCSKEHPATAVAVQGTAAVALTRPRGRDFTCRQETAQWTPSRHGSPLTAMRWTGFAFDAGLHLIVEYIETTVSPPQVGVVGHL